MTMQNEQGVAEESLVAEAIEQAFGERCPDFDPECWCCKAWAQYDALADRASRTADMETCRRETLEEAAEIAYEWGVRNPGPDHVSSGMKIAATIRALASKEEGR